VFDASRLYANLSAARTELYYIRQEQNLEMVLAGGLQRLIEINPASDRFTSYSSDGRGLKPATTGRMEYLTWVHPDHRKLLSRAVRDCLAGNRDDILVQYLVRHPTDADWRWVELGGHAERDRTGVVTKMIGTSCDITERKQLNDRVESQARALEAFAAEKVNFLAP
jgi:PAS domain-containing protein